MRLAAFTTSAGFAGFGGGLFAIVNAYVSPKSFQMTKSFDFLVGAIVGGITSISGAFIGALFIVFLPEWSADMNIALSGLIYGGVLVVMMLVARDGVVGLLGSLAQALRARLAPPRDTEPRKPLKRQTGRTAGKLKPDGRNHEAEHRTAVRCRDRRRGRSRRRAGSPGVTDTTIKLGTQAPMSGVGGDDRHGGRRHRSSDSTPSTRPAASRWATARPARSSSSSWTTPTSRRAP